MTLLALWQTPDMNNWNMVAERWGLPVAMMLLMGIAVFFLARKAMTIADRLATSHIALIDMLKEILPSLKGKAEQSSELLEDIQDGLREIKEDVRRMRS